MLQLHGSDRQGAISEDGAHGRETFYRPPAPRPHRFRGSPYPLRGIRRVGGTSPGRFPPSIRSFLDYWLARRVGGVAAIDPVDIPLLLPHLMLWTVRPAGDRLDFVCRLAGSDVNRHAGMAIRGRTLEELNPRNAERTRLEFERFARTGALHYVERNVGWIERPFLYYCRLLMPLARPGEGRSATWCPCLPTTRRDAMAALLARPGDTG